MSVEKLTRKQEMRPQPKYLVVRHEHNAVTRDLTYKGVICSIDVTPSKAIAVSILCFNIPIALLAPASPKVKEYRKL